MTDAVNVMEKNVSVSSYNKGGRTLIHRVGDTHAGLVLLHFVLCLRVLLIASRMDKVLLCPEIKKLIKWRDIELQVKYLNKCGFGPSIENIYFLYEAVILPNEALDIFSGTSEKLYDLTNRTVIGPSKKDWKEANSKIYFQSILTKLQQRPYGEIILASENVHDRLLKLLEKYSSGVFVKSDCSGGSTDSWSVDDISKDQILEMSDKDLVVQEKLKILEFFSAQYVWDEKSDSFVFLAFTTQLMQDGKHTGNAYPANLTSFQENEIKDICDRILFHYKKFGRSGLTYLSVDIVETDEGFFPLEINARKTAPYYGIEFTKKLFGEISPFYMYGASIPKNWSVYEFVSFLGDLAYNPKTKKGIIPFTHVPKERFSYVMIVSANEEEMYALKDAFLSRLQSYQSTSFFEKVKRFFLGSKD